MINFSKDLVTNLIDFKLVLQGIKGLVRNVTDFGIFIGLDEGIDGLVHISDMSWLKNIRHPKDMLQKGNEVKVKILEVSGENHRLSLGLKQIEEDPWPELKTVFTSGKVVEGTVLRILEKGIILCRKKCHQAFLRKAGGTIQM